MASRPKHTIQIGEGITVRRVASRDERPGGVCYWRAERYLGRGKRQTVWTGWATKQEAQQHVAGLLASGAIEGGQGQGASRKSRPADITSVKELIAVWFGTTQEDNATLSSNTIKSREEIGKRLVKHFGHVHPSRVNEVLLAEYRDSRLRTGAAPGSVFNEIRQLRQAWAWCRRQGLVAQDLFLPRKFIDPTPIRDKPTPTPEDVWKIVDWTRENCRAKHYGDLFELLGATGMRVGGAAGLRVKDFDLHHAELTIRHKGETRTIPLAESTIQLLQRRSEGLAQGGRIFHEVSEVNLPKGAGARLKRACKALGLKPMSPHALRRMVIELMLDKGVDVGTVAAYVGNSPATIYKYYRQVRPQQKRRAVALAGLGKRPDEPAKESEVLSLEARRAIR